MVYILHKNLKYTGSEKILFLSSCLKKNSFVLNHTQMIYWILVLCPRGPDGYTYTPESHLFITGTHFLLSTTRVGVSREGEEWECALLLWMWCSEDSSWNTSNSIRQHLQMCLRSALGLRDKYCLDNCLRGHCLWLLWNVYLWSHLLLYLLFYLQTCLSLYPTKGNNFFFFFNLPVVLKNSPLCQVLLIVLALQFSFILPPARKRLGTAILCTFSFISVHRITFKFYKLHVHFPVR